MLIGIDGNEANTADRVGVNQYAAQLLKALYELPEARKHEWIVYLKDEPLNHLPKAREGWKYKVLPGGGFWVLRKLTPHLWFCKKRPDIFFTPSHYAPPLLPIPMVMSVMDLGYLRFPEQFRRYDFYQLKYWGQWSMRQAKRILAISESTKKEITNHYPWTSSKVVVTYPGYDTERYAPREVKDSMVRKIKNKYGINKDYILFLSTLKPSKNIEGLLEAFSILQADVDLVVAGKKGWLYQAIFEKVKSLGLEKRVIFTNFIPEADKPPLIKGARVLASPSFWEGFGMHVVEAMALGVPVVVSNVGSLPEIVGSTGITVDPNNPNEIASGLSQVVSMPKNQYNNLARRCMARAGKFDWQKTARETLRVLESTK